MKKIRLCNWLIISTCILFLSCHNKVDHSNFYGIMLIKFKQVEYKNNVLARDTEYKDYLYPAFSMYCGGVIPQTCSTPYLDLPDGWLLLDWKWYYMEITAPCVIMTELTWEQVEFPDSILLKFPYSEDYISDPVEKLYSIEPKTIEKYSNATYGETVYRLIHDIVNPHPIYSYDELKGPCEQEDTMDSIWSIFQKDLAVAITNGDIDKLAKYDFAHFWRYQRR